MQHTWLLLCHVRMDYCQQACIMLSYNDNSALLLYYTPCCSSNCGYPYRSALYVYTSIGNHILHTCTEYINTYGDDGGGNVDGEDIQMMILYKTMTVIKMHDKM